LAVENGRHGFCTRERTATTHQFGQRRIDLDFCRVLLIIRRLEIPVGQTETP